MYKTIVFILLSILSFTINNQLMSFRTNDICKIFELENVGYLSDSSYVSRQNLPIISDEVADKFIELSLQSNVSCGFSISEVYRDSLYLKETLSPKLINAHIIMNILDAKLESLPVSPPGITRFDTDDEIWKSFNGVKLNNCYQMHVPHVIWPFQSPWRTIASGSKSSRKKQRKNSETIDDPSNELDHSVMTHFKFIASTFVMACFIVAVLLRRAMKILTNERMLNDIESGYGLKHQCFGTEKDIKQVKKMSYIQESRNNSALNQRTNSNNDNNIKCETPDKEKFTNQNTPHKHQIEQNKISVSPLVLNDGISVDITERNAVFVNGNKDKVKVSDTRFPKQIPELLTRSPVLTDANELSKIETCSVELNSSEYNLQETKQTCTVSNLEVKSTPSTKDISKTSSSVQLSNEERLKSSFEKEKIIFLESKKEKCRTIGYGWVHRVLLRKRKRRTSKKNPMLTESEKQNIKNDFLCGNPLLSEEADFMVCSKGDKSILVSNDDETVAKNEMDTKKKQRMKRSRLDNTNKSCISVNQVSNKTNINSTPANCNDYYYDNNSLYYAHYYQQQKIELEQHAFYSQQNNRFYHNASPNYSNNLYHTNPTFSYNQIYYNVSPYYYNQYYYNTPPYYNHVYNNTPPHYNQFYCNIPPYHYNQFIATSQQ